MQSSCLSCQLHGIPYKICQSKPAGIDGVDTTSCTQQLFAHRSGKAPLCRAAYGRQRRIRIGLGEGKDGVYVRQHGSREAHGEHRPATHFAVANCHVGWLYIELVMCSDQLTGRVQRTRCESCASLSATRRHPAAASSQR